MLSLVAGAVAARIVAGRMRRHAIGEMLDQRRAVIGAGPLRRPAGHRVDGEEIVAVDADAGEAEADRARGEGRLLAAGDALARRDRPLVVDEVEDDRRVIDRGEGQGVMEVAFGRGALADPGGGDPAVALVGGRHRPADRLRKLRAEIAGERKEAGLARGVEDGQLPALQPVEPVAVALAHHVEERPVAGDQEALLAIGREAHVARLERKGRADRDRLLAGAFHIERDLALALHPEHAVVEGAGQHHRPQRPPQRLGLELRVPWPDRLAVIVEHADEAIGEVAGLGRLGFDRRPRRRARFGELEITEVGRVARAEARLGDVQREGDVLFHALLTCARPPSPPLHRRRCKVRRCHAAGFAPRARQAASPGCARPRRRSDGRGRRRRH